MNPKLRGKVVNYRGAPVQIRTNAERAILRYGERVFLKDTFSTFGKCMVRVSPVDKPELVTAVYPSEIKFI